MLNNSEVAEIGLFINELENRYSNENEDSKGKQFRINSRD